MRTARAFVISLALVSVGAGLIFLARGWSAAVIGLMRLRVVNDTQQTVKIQPCWDLDCRSVNGLPMVIVGPGQNKPLKGKFEDDITQILTIGVLKPNAGVEQYDHCVVREFAPHTKVAVFHVATQTLVACPNVPEGGGGGG